MSTITWSSRIRMRSASICGRQMAVAEMPGEAREGGGVAGAHLDQVLVGGAHLDDSRPPPAEPVAAVQHDRLDEVEQEVEAAVAQHAQPPPIAVVEQQGDGVDPLVRRPAAGAHHGGRPFHIVAPSEARPPDEQPLRVERSSAAPSALRSGRRRGASEQEIALGHGQHGGRLAGQQLAVGAHLVGLRDRPRSRDRAHCAPCPSCRSCACP